MVAHEKTYYRLSLFCLILMLICLAVLLYLSPYLLFGLQYDVPEWVAHASVYFKLHHDVDGWLLVAALLLPWLVAGALFGWLSARLGNMSEKLKQLEETKGTLSLELGHRPTWLVLQIIVAIVMMVALLGVVEYLIYINTTAIRP